MITKETAKDMQLKAVLARMGRTSPERRSLAAKRAAIARWYRINGTDKERLHCYLRFFARLAKQLELEGDYNGASRTVMAMLPVELELLELRAEAMKDVTPAPESTDTKSCDKIVTDFGTGNPSPDKKNLLN